MSGSSSSSCDKAHFSQAHLEAILAPETDRFDRTHGENLRRGHSLSRRRIAERFRVAFPSCNERTVGRLVNTVAMSPPRVKCWNRPWQLRFIRLTQVCQPVGHVVGTVVVVRCHSTLAVRPAVGHEQFRLYGHCWGPTKGWLYVQLLPAQGARVWRAFTGRSSDGGTVG